MTTCSYCSAEMHADGFLCTPCRDELDNLLRNLPGLLTQLATTAYRQDHIGSPQEGKISKGASKPLPFRPEAAKVLQKANADIAALAVRWGIMSNRPGRLVLGSVMAHICVQIRFAVWDRAMADPQIGDTMALLVRTVATMEAQIDIPPVPIYLGRCDQGGCAREMYADRTVMVYGCECGETYNIATRMGYLIQQSRDTVASVPTIARALTSLDMPVTEAVIRKWKQRGLIAPVGEGNEYRVGDVIDLVSKALRREQERLTGAAG